MDNILKTTKLLYSCYYDKDGRIMKEPTGKIGRLKLPETHLAFLYRYIEFIMNSKLLNEASVIYIKSPYDVAKGVFEMYNKEHPEDPVNVKTAISNLDYNRRKMIKVFDDDMLTKVIYYPKQADMERYNGKLDDAMKRYNKGSIFDGKLMIVLPKNVGTVEPTEADISDFMMAVQAYRNVNRKLIEEQVASQFSSVIAYFNYLSTLTYRDEWQDDVWRQMNDFLNGKMDVNDVSDFPEFDDFVS